MKAILEYINGTKYLSFTPEVMEVPTTLPVITKGSRDKANAWSWNGSLENPTIRPSIRTKYVDRNGIKTEIHYWLTDGICHCLSDCKDGNSNKIVELKKI
jgi:hypothetical protein